MNQITVIIIAILSLIILVFGTLATMGFIQLIARNTTSNNNSQAVQAAFQLLQPLIEEYGFSRPQIVSLNYIVSTGQVGRLEVIVQGMGTSISKSEFQIIQIKLLFADLDQDVNELVRVINNRAGTNFTKPPLANANKRTWTPPSDITSSQLKQIIDSLKI